MPIRAGFIDILRNESFLCETSVGGSDIVTVGGLQFVSGWSKLARQRVSAHGGLKEGGGAFRVSSVGSVLRAGSGVQFTIPGRESPSGSSFGRLAVPGSSACFWCLVPICEDERPLRCLCAAVSSRG